MEVAQKEMTSLTSAWNRIAGIRKLQAIGHASVDRSFSATLTGANVGLFIMGYSVRCNYLICQRS